MVTNFSLQELHLALFPSYSRFTRYPLTLLISLISVQNPNFDISPVEQYCVVCFIIRSQMFSVEPISCVTEWFRVHHTSPSLQYGKCQCMIESESTCNPVPLQQQSSFKLCYQEGYVYERERENATRFEHESLFLYQMQFE